MRTRTLGALHDLAYASVSVIALRHTLFTQQAQYIRPYYVTGAATRTESRQLASFYRLLPTAARDSQTPRSGA